ncbi:hypothetical protein [Sulfitobacter aestuariivivens]|uniref:Uncharacterized protein n=1 Tax=Sulfitobacter aestuariivivens TaxID=2766981 RepID=A0A927D388_9RHOB|nr:hypothetical protein [Sulfitobacter aestuariivivens]MBD3662522.1 hypothetical protein [Sulfitobacter aestuariivivens]
MMRFVCALCFGILPGVLPAATLGEEDGITVNRLNQNDFEVIDGSFSGVAEYFWCGAATFVERRSGLPGLTEIYIKQPIGPSVTTPGRKGVVYSLSDAGLPPGQDSLTLSLDRAGAMMTAVKARSYCRDAFTRSTK